MAVIKLSMPNPIDGVASFNQIKFSEADDSLGTNSAVIATVNIDTTTRNALDSGSTHYNYISGDTAKYYAGLYYNSVTGATSSATDYIKGGYDRIDILFMNHYADTTGSVFSATDRDRLKKFALEALFPEIKKPSIDTSLSIDLTAGALKYTYSLPYGVYEVNEVGIGDVDNNTSRFSTIPVDNWMIENDKLHIFNVGSYAHGDTIRLLCMKKYQFIGEVPDRFDEMILNHMLMNSYLMLADDYPRFKRFARLQEGTKVSFENLKVHALVYEGLFNKAKMAATELPNSTRM